MQLFSNNAASTLAAAITVGSASLTVFAGEGVKFPAPVAPDFALVTLYQKSGTTEINHEIVMVTARTGDVMTITRAQEGTIARAFNAGDAVELRWTAGTVGNIVLPKGTRTSFNQTAAPVGWTKDVTAALNDTAMRIVTGAVGSGGVNSFSAAAYTPTITPALGTLSVAATTLTAAQIPAHTHPMYAFDPNGGAVADTTYANTSLLLTQAGLANTGGGGSHIHGLTGAPTAISSAITLSLKYNDFIIASKD